MSPVKTYFLVFDVSNGPPVMQIVAPLNQYLKDSIDILGYWNYIPLVYFFKSSKTAAELAPKFLPFFPSGRFVLGEVNPYNVNGWMPPDSWSWFYAPPQPRNMLAGIGAVGLGGNNLLKPPR